MKLIAIIIIATCVLGLFGLALWVYSFSHDAEPEGCNQICALDGSEILVKDRAYAPGEKLEVCK